LIHSIALPVEIQQTRRSAERSDGCLVLAPASPRRRSGLNLLERLQLDRGRLCAFEWSGPASECIDRPQSAEVQLRQPLDFADSRLERPRHLFRRGFQAHRRQQFLLADDEAGRPHSAVGTHPRRHLPKLPRDLHPFVHRVVGFKDRAGEYADPPILLGRRIQQVILQPLPEVLALVEPRVLRAAIGKVERIVVSRLGDGLGAAPRRVQPPDQVAAVERLAVPLVADLQSILYPFIEDPFVLFALAQVLFLRAVDVYRRKKRQPALGVQHHAVVVVRQFVFRGHPRPVRD
jgi:hypothetical protein